MLRRTIIVATIAVAATSGFALAHHGWGNYDASRVLKVTSAVESLKWENPHVHIDLRHQGAVWEAVLAPPFRMEARGLKPAMIKAGTTVTVEGYGSTRVEREMRIERITVAGKTYELR